MGLDMPHQGDAHFITHEIGTQNQRLDVLAQFVREAQHDHVNTEHAMNCVFHYVLSCVIGDILHQTIYGGHEETRLMAHLAAIAIVEKGEFSPYPAQLLGTAAQLTDLAANGQPMPEPIAAALLEMGIQPGE